MQDDLIFNLNRPPGEERNSTMSHQFQRWIITLGAEVRALHASIAGMDAEMLAKKMKTYEDELQQLYIYAEQRGINLITYYHPLAESKSSCSLVTNFSLSSGQMPNNGSNPLE